MKYYIVSMHIVSVVKKHNFCEENYGKCLEA